MFLYLILENSLEINIPDIIKTSAPGSYQPSLCLPFFLENKDLCVAITVMLYLEKTELLRGKCDQLFITIKRPYREVSTQTISRWTKRCLRNSGIDTSIFKAHSSRHAATSAASERGLLRTLLRTVMYLQQMFYKNKVIDKIIYIVLTTLKNYIVMSSSEDAI